MGVKRMFWRIKPYPTLIIICNLLLLAAIGFAYLGAPSSATAGDRHAWWLLLLSSIAVNVLTSFGAVLFGVSRIEREMQKYELQRNLGIVIDFWGRDALRANGFHIIYGGTLGAFRDDEKQYSSLATIYSIQALEEVFGLILGDEPSPRHTAFDKVDPKQAAQAQYNIILLGGYVSIPVLKEFPVRANLPYLQDFSDTNRRRVILVREERVSELSDTNDITSDYALVTIAVEASGRHLFWFSGNYGIATYGALLAATRNDARLQLGRPEPGEYFQAIVRVWSVQNSTLDPDHKEIEVSESISGKLPKDFSLAWLWPQPTPAATVSGS
jgi:hypothetical protein